ncbi:MAG: 50S ribosomal protein L18 [Candidatus Buchananbacteria bacterium]
MSKIAKKKQVNKNRRHRRVRAKISGTVVRPRLAVYRSLQHIYTQLIDDEQGKTLVAASDLEIKDKKIKKTEKATKVGELIAKKAAAKEITQAVFDRGGSKYHGRVKAVAEAARAAGLKI